MQDDALYIEVPWRSHCITDNESGGHWETDDVSHPGSLCSRRDPTPPGYPRHQSWRDVGPDRLPRWPRRARYRPVGRTGEFVHFSNAEKMRLMGVAAKRSRVPVIFNCSHSTFDGSVELAQAADASGAAAVLVMPPHFYRYTPGADCRLLPAGGEFRGVAKFLLLLVQHSAVHKRYRASRRPAICSAQASSGIKDSSGDAPTSRGLQSLRQQHSFTLMLGNDAFVVPARSSGCDGIISGCRLRHS